MPMYDDKLVEQYSGSGASGYDRQRESTPRFLSEERAFTDLFGRVSPAWAVDCPVGTGRWLESYRGLRGRVVGIDASEAMLAKAREKYASAGIDIRLIQGSIFDNNLFRSLSAEGKGLAVCIRFMNWIPEREVGQAIAALSECKPDFMILGVSVRPIHWSLTRRLAARLRLAKHNFVAFVKRLSLPKVHSEDTILRLFAEYGWSLAAKEYIYEDSARVNYFYLLTKSS